MYAQTLRLILLSNHHNWSLQHHRRSEAFGMLRDGTPHKAPCTRLLCIHKSTCNVLCAPSLPLPIAFASYVTNVPEGSVWNLHITRSMTAQGLCNGTQTTMQCCYCQHCIAVQRLCRACCTQTLEHGCSRWLTEQDHLSPSQPATALHQTVCSAQPQAPHSDDRDMKLIPC